MRLRAIAAALLVASGLFAAPAADPAPAAAMGPLPACRLDDILTDPIAYDDWSITLVDWILTLGPKYRPPDLVDVHQAGVQGSGLVRRVAIDDLEALADAARENGTPLVSWSAFRSFKQQVELFNIYRRGDGFKDAITYSARPGHSEHQLGLTVDFVGVGDDGLTSNWEVTRTGGWMAKNAWKYGWLMSYPKGRDDVACYHYEPWHYRYVGRDLAAKIHDSGLTIREYLWANYTRADTDCSRPPAPTVGPKTSAPPCDSPSPVPSEAIPSPGGRTPSGEPGGPAATSRQGAVATGTGQPSLTPSKAILGLDPAVFVGVVMLGGLALVGLLAARRSRSRARARVRWR
jgi:zinc D-Ala-D-Ala carboxypeptidase